MDPRDVGLLQDMGRLEEARPMLQESLAMERRLWGDRDHSNVAAGLGNPGGLLQAMGRLDDTLVMVQASVDMHAAVGRVEGLPSSCCWLLAGILVCNRRWTISLVLATNGRGQWRSG